MGFFGSIGGIGGSYTFVRNAEKRVQSSQNNQKKDPIADMQNATLSSLRLVLEKLKTDQGNRVFMDDDKLFEACAVLEDSSFSAGRDILLTLFMKKLPQKYVAAIDRSDVVFKEVRNVFKTCLLGELGMSPEFAQRILNIFSKTFTK